MYGGYSGICHRVFLCSPEFCLKSLTALGFFEPWHTSTSCRMIVDFTPVSKELRSRKSGPEHMSPTIPSAHLTITCTPSLLRIGKKAWRPLFLLSLGCSKTGLRLPALKAPTSVDPKHFVKQLRVPPRVKTWTPFCQMANFNNFRMIGWKGIPCNSKAIWSHRNSCAPVSTGNSRARSPPLSRFARWRVCWTLPLHVLRNKFSYLVEFNCTSIVTMVFTYAVCWSTTSSYASWCTLGRGQVTTMSVTTATTSSWWTCPRPFPMQTVVSRMFLNSVVAHSSGWKETMCWPVERLQLTSDAVGQRQWLWWKHYVKRTLNGVVLCRLWVWIPQNHAGGVGQVPRTTLQRRQLLQNELARVKLTLSRQSRWSKVELAYVSPGTTVVDAPRKVARTCISATWSWRMANLASVISTPGWNMSENPPPWGVAPRGVKGWWLCPWLADRLFGAKPVTWKGRGDLPQVPWSKPTKGSWLVLDLWSGLGGLCMALLQCGLHFFAIAAEMDPVASELCATNLPNVIHIPRVESIRAEALRPFLRRRQIRGIIMGGGSPCQPNSSLNSGRQGLGDIRSHQPLVMIQLRDEIKALPEASGLELVSFLENVGSMPRDVESQYSSWMGGSPIRIDAALCGWVHRNRLYWLIGSKGPISDECRAPDDWDWNSDSRVLALQFVGCKPLPPRVHLDQGYQLLIDPQHILRKKGEGAMHTFTREFLHPSDRVALGSHLCRLVLPNVLWVTPNVSHLELTRPRLWRGRDHPGELCLQVNVLRS